MVLKPYSGIDHSYKYLMVFAALIIFHLAYPSKSYSENTIYGSDTIYLSKPGHTGVFTEEIGKVIKLTPKEVIFEKNGNRYLFSRVAVQRIKLSKGHPGHVNSISDFYWNQEDALSVKLTRGFPIFNDIFSAIDNKYLSVFFSILILIGLFVYIAYRVYVFLVITNNQRNLNFDKLNMEVRKLHYELDGIEKRISAMTGSGIDPKLYDQKEKAHLHYQFEIPKLHIWDFIKHKIFRALTVEEKKIRVEKWCVKWQKLKGGSKFIRVLKFYYLWGLNICAFIFMLEFCIGSVLYTFQPSFDPTTSFGEGPVISLLFFVSSVFSFAVLIRISSSIKIIRQSYRQTFSEDS